MKMNVITKTTIGAIELKMIIAQLLDVNEQRISKKLVEQTLKDTLKKFGESFTARDMWKNSYANQKDSANKIYETLYTDLSDIEGLETALTEFLNKVSIAIPSYKFSITMGRKYIKVWIDAPSTGKIIWAFVSISTGDIFKPASYKAPAAHPRGNIFSVDNGMESVVNGNIRYLK